MALNHLCCHLLPALSSLGKRLRERRVPGALIIWGTWPQDPDTSSHLGLQSPPELALNPVLTSLRSLKAAPGLTLTPLPYGLHGRALWAPTSHFFVGFVNSYLSQLIMIGSKNLHDHSCVTTGQTTHSYTPPFPPPPGESG